jgi:hypothetical protein
MSALTRDQLAELIYPEPQPYDTAEAFAKFHHDDIASLNDEQLDDQRLLARLVRALSPRPSAWLVERITRLEIEAGRRRERAERTRR